MTTHRYAQPTYQPAAIDWPFQLPADGIEHQVIQTDICRYLGGEARVKRGYDPQTGRDAFDYCAYRPLTSAMIQSLKDSSTAFREALREARSRGDPPPEYYRYAMSRGRRPPEPSTLQYEPQVRSTNPSSYGYTPPQTNQYYTQPQEYTRSPDYYSNVPQIPSPYSTAEGTPRTTTRTITSPPIQDTMPGSMSATQPPPPLDPVTRLPIQGYWGRDANGDEVFYRYKTMPSSRQ